MTRKSPGCYDYTFRNDMIVSKFLDIRILQVMMLGAKFGRIIIRTNLLQRFDSNFGHFDNKICYKIDKMNCEFSNEIADSCSIRLATLPQKDCKYLLKLGLNFFKIFL